MCAAHILIVWTGCLVVHLQRCKLLHFVVNAIHYFIALKFTKSSSSKSTNSTYSMLHTYHKRLLSLRSNLLT